MEKAAAEGLLKSMLGAKAEFRAGQWETIDLAANRRERLIVVQRTGWGKSVVYFLATKILRDSGSGPTLLISPLLALMRNQLLAADKLGLRSHAIHSENQENWSQIGEELRNARVDLLMIAPERLGNAEFLQRILPSISGNIGMFDVDEAHCISDWGHDFRPDYRCILRLLQLLPSRVPVLCTTATANNRVVQDIHAQIPDAKIIRGPLVRDSLSLFNIKLDDQADRLAWLAHFLQQLTGSGIIYTLTVQDACRVAEWLGQHDINARAYHADLEAEQRIEAEQQLLENKVKALVSTVALGMGFDKPDLGFVIHFQRPGSVVAYYQQVGRAGRAVDSAFGILLNGREDDEIQDFFIESAFPPVNVLQDVLNTLATDRATTLDGIGAKLNRSRGTIEKAIRLLDVDGAVRHDGSGYVRTNEPWEPDIARFNRVTQHRRNELIEMKRYVEHSGCLMEFLARALDDPAAGPCGKCMNCRRSTSRRSPPTELTEAAMIFLRGNSPELKPRDRWPKPLLDEIHGVHPGAVELSEKGALKTIIPERFGNRPGRILCIWGDAGWGGLVTQGKYNDNRFNDLLVDAVATLVREKWKPAPQPEWITAVPSLERATLVSDFAERLAKELGLPYLATVRKVRPTRPQKEMQNSAQQLRNLIGAFQVAGPVPSGPVLLVDDVVDSGWTMTLLGVLLQQRGSGLVFPMALAKSSPRSI